LQPLGEVEYGAIKWAENGAPHRRGVLAGVARVLLRDEGRKEVEGVRAEEKMTDGVREARDDWRENLVETGEAIRELLGATRRVAVLGMKTEAQSYQPAFYVPRYLVSAGLEVVPVPVYYPEVTHILGLRVYRKLSDVPGEVDMVDVFRRAQDIPPHLEDILAKRPRSVWFQSGIRNDAAAERLARAGIKVVQDRCLMVEHRSFLHRR
jgi:predicted CoA-binding protein